MYTVPVYTSAFSKTQFICNRDVNCISFANLRGEEEFQVK